MWASSAKFDGHAELVEEIGSLERLVNQLLDIARLDVLQLEAGDVADLNQVATDVASHLGPAAINARRSIEVIAPDEPVRIEARATICSGRCAISWKMLFVTRRKGPRSRSWSLTIRLRSR